MKTLFRSLLLINFIAIVPASPANLSLELTSQVHTTDVEPRLESQDRTFSFTLPSCSFVLRSTTQSSSTDDTKTGDGGQLIISGVFDNPESINTEVCLVCLHHVHVIYLTFKDINQISQNLYGEAARKVGYVKSAVMWELGTGIYLAVASGFPNKMIAVFRYDRRDPAKGWKREEDLAVDQDVSNLKAFTFSNLTKTHTHLYAVRYNDHCIEFVLIQYLLNSSEIWILATRG